MLPETLREAELGAKTGTQLIFFGPLRIVGRLSALERFWFRFDPFPLTKSSV